MVAKGKFPVRSGGSRCRRRPALVDVRQPEAGPAARQADVGGVPAVADDAHARIGGAGAATPSVGGFSHLHNFRVDKDSLPIS